ncbi:TPA: hypothetical protein JLQ67_001757 [Escherichia coli]|nr:hypothetical protein [Escherichia coli]
MKKTLIALAVAASAAVSGSAMAWTANGTGGSVDLGGTLTPADKVTPWEVKVGTAVNSLDAVISKGDAKVDIPVKNAIQVLAIRTQLHEVFVGKNGITPQINYHGALDTSGISGSVGKLSLEIKDPADNKIGKMEANLLVAAQMNRKGLPNTSLSYVNDHSNMYAASTQEAFYGGLGINDQSVSSSALGRIRAVFPDIYDNYIIQGTQDAIIADSQSTDNPEISYSAYYGSGIESGQKINITLDQTVSGDAPIQWKASLPITVSYM